MTVDSKTAPGHLAHAASEFDVFLCHNSADKAAVKEIGQALRDFGVVPWLDEWELRPGLPWQKELERQIPRIRSAAVFVGREGTGPWQDLEVDAFLREFVNRGCPVIPVILSDSVGTPDLPFFLKGMTWVDFRESSPDPMERLVWGITDRKPQPRYQDDNTRSLSESLEDAYRERAELRAAGKKIEADHVTETILGLKRRIREGGQLKAGDFLLDGRFQLLETIGRGGFAEVWKAYDQLGRDVVAVKVLHGQYARDETRRERFFRGARHMARLRHPGIVQVVEERCEDGGFHFFVMEFVAGGDLKQVVKAGGLSPEQGIRVVREVGEALAFAHEHGVVHRDVKPGNVLLDAEGCPKLTDFDLVRAVDTTGGTRTTGLGTFLYAAPEAMMDAREASEPADVYGLGMTAIFALYGADLPVDVLWELPDFVEGLTLSDRCRAALLRAVARKVEDRWSTVGEFCQALPERPFAEAIVQLVEKEMPEMWTRWTDPVLGIEFAYIEPREFLMGSPEDEVGRFDREKLHRVKLTRGFWIATTAVTQRQFNRFVKDAGAEVGWWQRSLRNDHPVVNVSWYEADSFCEWLSRLTGNEIRLPTEAEWECAARAGTESAIYSSNLDEIAWYRGNHGGYRSRPVGKKKPNGWGLYDMLGNAYEWCADWYGDYGAGMAVDPSGLDEGGNRVSRGGSWYSYANRVRAAFRNFHAPTYRWHLLGFRLARGHE